MQITIKNNFHNTEAKIRVKELPAVLSRRQVNRVRRHLCGIHDCTCGGNLSERGAQPVDIKWTPDGIMLFTQDA